MPRQAEGVRRQIEKGRGVLRVTPDVHEDSISRVKSTSNGLE